MPTGGFMLHATLFLQLRILNHTYYLAPVDSAHREAVKKHIRRWIASARGPISPQTGNLLLRYAVTIPRPVVRKQIQKIADKARKEALAGSSQNNAAVINDPIALQRRKSSLQTGGSLFSPEQENTSSPQISTDAPQLDQNSAESSEEPPGFGTDGVASAQFVFRDPFLCAVDPRVAQRASVMIHQNQNNNINHQNSNHQHRNSTSTTISPSRRTSSSTNQQNNQNQQQPMNARVELAPPLATIEQELIHGITMRDHQSCCCPHRMDLPDVLQDGWAASVRASTIGNNNSNNNHNNSKGLNNSVSSSSQQFNNSTTSNVVPNSSNFLNVPGLVNLQQQQPDQLPPTSPTRRSSGEQHQQQQNFFEPPKMEEQTIHGAVQIPHPFGHSLSFGLSIRHNTHGKLKSYSATSILEPLFSNNKKRRQYELSMESSFNFSGSGSGSGAASGRLSNTTPPRRTSTATASPHQYAGTMSNSSSSYQNSPATIFVNQHFSFLLQLLVLL